MNKFPAQKIIFYLVYILYLWMSKNFYASLVILPLIFLIKDINLKNKLLLILIFTFLDVPLIYQYISPYDATFSLQRFYSYKWFLPIAMLSALFAFLLFLFLAALLAQLRKRTSVSAIIFYFLLIPILITIHRYYSSQASLFAFVIVSIITLTAKKAWLVYLFSYERNFLSGPTANKISAYLFPAANFRETYDLKPYDDSHEFLSKNFFFLCGGTLLGYFFIYQLNYFITGSALGPIIIKAPTLHMNCHAPANFFEKSVCILNRRISLDIFKGVLLDTMIFYLAPVALGFNLPRPWSNFWNAKNWTSFLGRLFYYYSLIISQVFVQGLYKQAYFWKIKNRELRLFVAVFLGVWWGGICFHLLKDFVFVNEHGYPNVLHFVFSFRFNIYFILIALSCAFVESFKGRINALSHKLLIVVFLVIFLTLRSEFASYFLK